MTPEQECAVFEVQPVAWRTRRKGTSKFWVIHQQRPLYQRDMEVQPLYLTLPARQPMTEDDRARILMHATSVEDVIDRTERHHGITAAKGEQP